MKKRKITLTLLFLAMTHSSLSQEHLNLTQKGFDKEFYTVNDSSKAKSMIVVKLKINRKIVSYDNIRILASFDNVTFEEIYADTTGLFDISKFKTEEYAYFKIQSKSRTIDLGKIFTKKIRCLDIAVKTRYTFFLPVTDKEKATRKFLKKVVWVEFCDGTIKRILT